MRNQLLSTVVACAACLAWGAQAQTSSDPSSSTDPNIRTAPGSSSTYQGAAGSSRYMSPTGRMAQEAVRGSQLTGAPVSNSTGNTIGTISDIIVNPATGRLEFAVVSLSSAAGSATSGTSPGSPTTQLGTTASASGTSGKQVAVPWMLLRPSPTAGIANATGASSTTQQPSFVFAGDASKLESAPNFDANTDLSQPSWRQSVFSYFGLAGRGFGATGAAGTPGGTSNGSGSENQGGSLGKP